MSECQVLRCAKTSSAILQISEAPLLQALVCDEHRAMISAGASWEQSIESDGKMVIYMGTDASPRLSNFQISDPAADSSERAS